MFRMFKAAQFKVSFDFLPSLPCKFLSKTRSSDLAPVGPRVFSLLLLGGSRLATEPLMLDVSALHLVCTAR